MDEQMEKRILKKIRAGDILLFHDSVPEVPLFLDSLIPKLKAKGFTFVTI
jgi:peptidoglycan/xylan/chitin deacetylase (PgdA/CDA1 family)